MNLQFWLNAFIPRNVPNYTRLINKGTHAGKTAIPLPKAARANPFNWKEWDAGYLTDQRTFDNSLSASHRMQSFIEVRLDKKIDFISSNHSTSGTTEINLETGDLLGFDWADMDRCSFSALSSYQPTKPILGSKAGERLVGARTALNAKAGDPLVSAAMDIDYVGIIEIVTDPLNPSNCHISFEGKIDEFPAYECYAKLGEVTKTIFTSEPPAGNTVVDLFWYANRPISGSARFP